MDGDGRRQLLNYSKGGLLWPNGLTLDHTNNRLYWVDAWYNSLDYYDFERNTTAFWLLGSVMHPFGLTLFEDYLYWTSWDYNMVFRTETPPQHLTSYISDLGKPMDIHVYDRNKKLSGKTKKI